MTLKDTIIFLYGLQDEDLFNDRVNDCIVDLRCRLEVMRDFGLSKVFEMNGEEIAELYTSVRSDLVEETKEHDKKCDEIINKYK